MTRSYCLAQGISQYPVINHQGKNMKKDECVCITESLCYVAEINTTLQIINTSKK